MSNRAPDINEILRSIRNLEPFPHVAAEVLQLASEADPDPEELIELVLTDPGLTGKVLKLCNSAYYGFQREIPSLTEAGRLLGVRTIASLVITSSTQRFFRGHGTPGESRSLWSRCLGNALAARQIAREHGQCQAETAYTAGLLQDIGELVVERFAAENRKRVADAVQVGCGLLDAERAVLGMHHAEIGARLVSRWNLPDLLVDTIRHHHQPEEAVQDRALAATVHLADLLTRPHAVDEELDAGAEELVCDVSRAALELTGFSSTEFEEFGVRVGLELERAFALMDGME